MDNSTAEQENYILIVKLGHDVSDLKRRLEKQEQITETVRDIAASVSLLAERMSVMQNDVQETNALVKENTKETNKQIKEIQMQLDAVRFAPAQKWDKFIWMILGVVVTTIVAFVLTKVGF